MLPLLGLLARAGAGGKTMQTGFAMGPQMRDARGRFMKNPAQGAKAMVRSGGGGSMSGPTKGAPAPIQGGGTALALPKMGGAGGQMAAFKAFATMLGIMNTTLKGIENNTKPIKEVAANVKSIRSVITKKPSSAETAKQGLDTLTPGAPGKKGGFKFPSGRKMLGGLGKLAALGGIGLFMAGMLTEIADALKDKLLNWLTGDDKEWSWAELSTQFKESLKKMPAVKLGAAIGGGFGFLVGGPIGMVAGAIIGGALGMVLGLFMKKNAPDLTEQEGVEKYMKETIERGGIYDYLFRGFQTIAQIFGDGILNLLNVLIDEVNSIIGWLVGDIPRIEKPSKELKDVRMRISKVRGSLEDVKLGHMAGLADMRSQETKDFKMLTQDELDLLPPSVRKDYMKEISKGAFTLDDPDTKIDLKPGGKYSMRSDYALWYAYVAELTKLRGKEVNLSRQQRGLDPIGSHSTAIEHKSSDLPSIIQEEDSETTPIESRHHKQIIQMVDKFEKFKIPIHGEPSHKFFKEKFGTAKFANMYPLMDYGTGKLLFVNLSRAMQSVLPKGVPVGTSGGEGKNVKMQGTPSGWRYDLVSPSDLLAAQDAGLGIDFEKQMNRLDIEQQGLLSSTIGSEQQLRKNLQQIQEDAASEDHSSINGVNQNRKKVAMLDSSAINGLSNEKPIIVVTDNSTNPVITGGSDDSQGQVIDYGPWIQIAAGGRNVYRQEYPVMPGRAIG